MKIYKIICTSRCGSYFTSYLQSVTVIADNEEDAIANVEKWLKGVGDNFIYPKSEWHIVELNENIINNAVIDYSYDSDY